MQLLREVVPAARRVALRVDPTGLVSAINRPTGNVTGSKSHQVDKLREGHLLRWTKQMALRGKGHHPPSDTPARP
jgi:hypothetical protein